MPNDSETLYSAAFFDAQSASSLQSARVALGLLFDAGLALPSSVLDVGCGVGPWLRAVGEIGVVDRLGVDGDYVDRSALLVPPDLFIPVDLATQNVSDIVKRQRRARFDWVMCLEVAEHLPFDRSSGFVEELCELGDVVLFSAAIPYQHGTGHINEQWPEFWATLFRANGYACFDLLRSRLWARDDVEWWYAQNLLVFARRDSEAAARLSRQNEVVDRALAMVHPRAWLSSILNIWHPRRAAARDDEPADYQAVLRAWTDLAPYPPSLRAVERARRAPPDARDVFPFTRTEVGEPERLLAEAAATLAARERALREARDRCAALTEERDARAAALIEAGEREARLAHDVAALRDAAAAKASAAAALEHELRAKCDEADTEARRLARTLGDATLERASLRAGLHRAQAVAAATRKHLTATSGALEIARAAITTLRSQNERLREDEVTMRHGLTSAADHVSALERQSRILQAEIDVARQEIATARDTPCARISRALRRVHRRP
jgi:SAM-dependent methyltransferase